MPTRKGTSTKASTRSASKSAPAKRVARKQTSVAHGTAGHADELILAIDVGGTGLKAAVIDAHGEMKSERVRMATPHPCTPAQLVDALAGLVEPLLAQLHPTRMSIGFPGVVRDNCILTAPHLGDEGWHGVPLAAMLAERLGGLPVHMINDAEMQGFAAIEGHGIEFVLTLGTRRGAPRSFATAS